MQWTNIQGDLIVMDKKLQAYNMCISHVHAHTKIVSLIIFYSNTQNILFAISIKYILLTKIMPVSQISLSVNR